MVMRTMINLNGRGAEGLVRQREPAVWFLDRLWLGRVMKTNVPKLARGEEGERAAALSDLGRRLSAARTQAEAAQILMQTVDKLFGWDACTFNIYSPEQESVSTVLYMDTINGERVDVSAECVDR